MKCSTNSSPDDYIRDLPQDHEFTKLCLRTPEEFSCNIVVDGDEDTLGPEDTLILSAAAFCDNGIDHLLDGYSWGLFMRISCDIYDTRKIRLSLKCLKIAEDEQLRLSEMGDTERKFGLFNGRLPFWKKILGRLPTLLLTGRAIERQTAHQPIFYPYTNQAYFCSAYTYPAFNISWPKDNSSVFEVARKRLGVIPGSFPKSHYTCMHPLFDSDTFKTP